MLHVHGGLEIPTAASEPGEPARDQDRRTDYCNLYGPPTPEETYRGLGAGRAADTHAMLKRLVDTLRRTDTVDHVATADGPIPSGYTYLAQFATHDMVLSLARPSGPGEPATPSRNMRHSPLLLDTLYAGGPAAMPIAYALEEGGDRVRLRIGRVRVPGLGGGKIMSGAAAERDIPRVVCPFLNDEFGPGAPDVLICDPRNDDNAVISQLTVLFIRLHNMACARLAPAAASGGSGAPLRDDAAKRLFWQARRSVAFAFRKILREDLLVRLLHPAVHDHYFGTTGGRTPPVAWEDEHNRMPVEFSHAAFRIGHAMVRPHYVLNDGIPGHQRRGVLEMLAMNSADRPQLMPMPSDWVISWKHFFEMDDATAPNRARRIGPWMVRAFMEDGVFGARGDLNEGLLLIDLWRGLEAGVRSVDSLIALAPPELRMTMGRLGEAAGREAVLSSWLAGLGGDLTEDDIDCLSAHPPLLLYLLVEAMEIGEGDRLGPLGSIIVAEVFSERLRETQHRVEDDQAVLRAVETVFGDAVPATMPDLVRFVEAAP